MLFIHQFPDWTKFRYNYQSVLNALGRTRLQEGVLAGLSQLVFLADDDFSDLKDNFLIDDFAVKPEKMNGIARSVREFKISKELLFNWHSLLEGKQIREFRSTENAIAQGEKVFQGVACYRLNAEMERFINWVQNSKEETLIKAAIAQFWLLTIRPFNKKNGALARLVTSALLQKSKTPLNYNLNAQILSCKNEYFEILYKCQCGNGDLTEWILFFLNLLENAFRAAVESFKPQIKKLQFKSLCEGAAMNTRLEVFLSKKYEENEPFSVKEYADFAGISHDSALRDIQKMMAQGFVKKGEKNGRSTRYFIA